MGAQQEEGQRGWSTATAERPKEWRGSDEGARERGVMHTERWKDTDSNIGDGGDDRFLGQRWRRRRKVLPRTAMGAQQRTRKGEPDGGGCKAEEPQTAMEHGSEELQ